MEYPQNNLHVFCLERVENKQHKDCYIVRYKCPHCNKIHSHGCGKNDRFPLHRGSHCLKTKGDVIIHNEDLEDY